MNTYLIIYLPKSQWCPSMSLPSYLLIICLAVYYLWVYVFLIQQHLEQSTTSTLLKSTIKRTEETSKLKASVHVAVVAINLEMSYCLMVLSISRAIRKCFPGDLFHHYNLFYSALNIEAHHGTDSERLRRQMETPFAETIFKGFSSPLTESILEDH